MRRLVIFVIVGINILFSGVTAAEKIFFAKYTVNNIIIDGADDGVAWKQADSISFNGLKQGSENTVCVKSLWNEDFLYFLFKVTDTNLQAHQTEQDHPELFLDDMVEFLIDTTNDKDSCWNETKIVYHINLNGIKKDDRGTSGCISNPAWNGNAVYAVKLFGTLNDQRNKDVGYQVEVAVPWSDINQLPVKNLVLGVNFANGDNDNNGRELFDWLGIFPFRSPHLFGNLVLKE